jgi:hypothetical protein
MADIIFPGEEPLSNLGTTKLPENVDLSIWQGDAQTYIMRLTADNNAPIDLAGCTAQATVRQSFTAPARFEFVCTIQNTNEVKVYMSSATSASIPAGSYVWNFQVTAPNGDVRTYLAGDCTVYAQVDGV